LGGEEVISTSIKTNSHGDVVETVTTTASQSSKTLWDLLSILGIPLALIWTTQWLQNREKENAQSKQNEKALQEFIDWIENYLAEEDLIRKAERLNQFSQEKRNNPGSIVNEINEGVYEPDRKSLSVAKRKIEAKTLSILRDLSNDAVRKASVIRYLSDSSVFKSIEPSLKRIDLSNLNLSSINLQGLELYESNLEGTNLDFSCIGKTKFENTPLDNISLRYEDLKGIRLVATTLRHTNLSNADLTDARFLFVDLKGSKGL
jgi:hypothetical protein